MLAKWCGDADDNDRSAMVLVDTMGNGGRRRTRIQGSHDFFCINHVSPMLSCRIKCCLVVDLNWMRQL